MVPSVFVPQLCSGPALTCVNVTVPVLAPPSAPPIPLLFPDPDSDPQAIPAREVAATTAGTALLSLRTLAPTWSGEHTSVRCRPPCRSCDRSEPEAEQESRHNWKRPRCHRSRPSALPHSLDRPAGNHCRIPLRHELPPSPVRVCASPAGDGPGMPTKTAARNLHDPRVRELIRATGNADLFPEGSRAPPRPASPCASSWPSTGISVRRSPFGNRVLSAHRGSQCQLLASPLRTAAAR